MLEKFTKLEIHVVFGLLELWHILKEILCKQSEDPGDLYTSYWAVIYSLGQ